MAKKPDGSTKLTGLRRQAEEALRATNRDVAAMPVKDVQQLVHELQVHQIELEMQNDELRRAQMELEAARDRYVDLYDFSPAGHLTLNTQGKIVEANLRAGTLLGINRRKLIGQPLARFIAPSDEGTFHRHCQEVLKTGTQQTCEVHLREKAGASACVHLASLAVHEESGRITHWRTSLLDVSDRKLAEFALHESEARLRVMLDHSPSLIFLKDLKGRYLDVNQQFERTFHLIRQGIIGKTDHDIFPPEQATAFRANDLKVLEAGRSLQSEEVALHDDGPHTSIVSKFLLRRLDGTPYAICGITTDITERKWAEAAMREALETLDATRDGAFIFDPLMLRFSYVNEGAVRQVGYSREELLRMTPLDIKPEFDEPRFRAMIAPLVSGAESAHSFTTVHRRKDGVDVPVEINLQCVGAGTARARMIAIVRDITERKRAEEERAFLTLRNEALVKSFGEIVYDWRPREDIVIWDGACTEVLGYTLDEMGSNTESWMSRVHPDDLQRVLDEVNRATQEHRLVNLEYRFKRNDRSYCWMHDQGVTYVDERGTLKQLIGVFRDITERKVAEEALQASDAFTRAVLNSLSAHVCVLDKDGVILKTNDAWKEFAIFNSDRTVTGVDVGQNYLDVCRRAIAGGESSAQVIVDGVAAVLGGSQPSFSAEYACHSPEEERWFMMRVTPLKEAQGVVISHTDISGRVRMAQLLEQNLLLLDQKRGELESLSGKLIQAQEQERKRIARELHDDFNQRLAALSVELESMERAPIAPPEPVARQLGTIRVQVGQLSDDLHDLAYRLHPSLLDHVGLEVAMRDHVAEFTKRTGLPVMFTAREVPGTLSPEIATNLFRVMQESLQNVSKHAQATDVTVRLSGSSKGIGVSVRDNGKGFDLESKDARVNGLGLVSMQERARGLGGFLRIHSLPRNGTKVCAWIPRYRDGA